MQLADLWRQELLCPDEGFSEAFVRAVRVLGPEALVRQAVVELVSWVDWAGCLPYVPHGLLGLSAVFRLRSLLEGDVFLRLLGAQLHAFACEGRAAKSMEASGRGSGHWGQLQMAVERHLPSVAFGEAMGLEFVEAGDFSRIGAWIASDMACIGHKPVMARTLEQLFHALGRPQDAGRMLLGITAWLAAAPPVDLFWSQRLAKRLPLGCRLLPEDGEPEAEEIRTLAREVCDLGLVAMLDRFGARVRQGAYRSGLMAGLVAAATEKQLDARRDLEGKTAWNFVYLAAIRDASEAATWGQGAALVNLFPSEEERLEPGIPRTESLLDAILDGEPREAMALALRLHASGGAEPVLRILAQAAALNDPGLNHSYQILALAATSELIGSIPSEVSTGLLMAMAKFLSNSQTYCDIGRSLEACLKLFND